MCIRELLKISDFLLYRTQFSDLGKSRRSHYVAQNYSNRNTLPSIMLYFRWNIAQKSRTHHLSSSTLGKSPIFPTKPPMLTTTGPMDVETNQQSDRIMHEQF